MQIIKHPSNGTNVVIPSEKGVNVELDFDTANATFERQEGNLIINFNDGNSVELESFFNVGEGGSLPDIVLEDGTQIAAADFLTAINADFDVTPAAGPNSPSSPTSSGVGAYQDDAGNLISGVDRLGDQESFQWEVTSNSLSLGQQQAQFVALSGGEPGGVIPPPPAAEPKGHAHVVISNDLADGTYKFYPQDSDGNLIKGAQPSITFENGNSNYFTCVTNSNGEIEIKLTQDGKQALANGESFGDSLLINIDGHQYYVDLFGSGRSDSYDHVSRDEDINLNDLYSDLLLGEWYNSQGKIIDNAEIKLAGIGHNELNISTTQENSAGTALSNSTINMLNSNSATVNINSNQSSPAIGLDDTTLNVSAKDTSDIHISASVVGQTTQAGQSSSAIAVKDSTILVNEAKDSKILIEASHGDLGGSATGILASDKGVIIGSDDDESRSSITIKASALGDATGIKNVGSYTAHVNSGDLTINAADLTIDVSSNATACGIRTEGNTNTSITLEEDANITVEGSVLSGVAGIAIIGEGASNSISAGKGISIDVKGSDGIFNLSGSSNLTAKDGNIDISVENASAGANGLTADSGSNSLKSSNDINISAISNASSTRLVSSGVFAKNEKGSNILEADGNANITAKAVGDNAHAKGLLSDFIAVRSLDSTDSLSSFNKVTGENITVSAHGDQGASATGAYTMRSTANILTARNDVFMNVTADGAAAFGLEAFGGENTITAGRDVSIVVKNTSEKANTNSIGLTAMYGGKNSITAEDNINISVESSSRPTYGMYATENGQNNLSADSVTISAESKSTNHPSDTYGMYATENGQNTINSASESRPFTVTLTAESGSFDKSIAMWASNGKNVIDGRNSSESDITINGGFFAEDGGQNIIYGSNAVGSDNKYTINGTINSSPSNGAEPTLIINGNADGTDTVILQAKDSSAFIEQYGSWLVDCQSNTAIKNIDNIVVDVNGSNFDQAGLDEIHSYFAELGAIGDTEILYNVNGEHMNYDEASQYFADLSSHASQSSDSLDDSLSIAAAHIATEHEVSTDNSSHTLQGGMVSQEGQTIVNNSIPNEHQLAVHNVNDDTSNFSTTSSISLDKSEIIFSANSEDQTPIMLGETSDTTNTTFVGLDLTNYITNEDGSIDNIHGQVSLDKIINAAISQDANYDKSNTIQQIGTNESSLDDEKLVETLSHTTNAVEAVTVNTDNMFYESNTNSDTDQAAAILQSELQNTN